MRFGRELLLRLEVEFVKLELAVAVVDDGIRRWMGGDIEGNVEAGVEGKGDADK
jgi:hypothetical protein